MGAVRTFAAACDQPSQPVAGQGVPLARTRRLCGGARQPFASSLPVRFSGRLARAVAARPNHAQRPSYEHGVMPRTSYRRENPHLGDWRSWYQLERWRRIRRKQLAKEPLCRFCLAQGLPVPATIADHVVSHRGDWNAFLIGELQSLCKHCHDSTKRLDDSRSQIDDDGWPIDAPSPVPNRAARGSVR
jgi:5-methylcytosine-specific restriction enzyme A